MKKTISVLASTIFGLVLLDIVVAVFLSWADDKGGRMQSLVRYFEYGRSVPGKLERWAEAPDLRENLFDVAWADAGLAASAEQFEEEMPGLVARGYGMSFLAQLLTEANALNPDLSIDLHGGPAAPPNLAYDLFLQDRSNRRAGDVVVFGILSSSVPAMASFSNRTWLFEQPAPLTYPIFVPDDEAGLRRIAPFVTSAEQQRDLIANPNSTEAIRWAQQLREEDRLYTNAAFALPQLDRSPLVRLTRRSLATNALADRTSELMAGDFAYQEVLTRMVRGFAEIARADGQVPIVYLIQSRDPQDMDVLAATRDTLEADGIAYIATVDHADPRDPSVFVADGHYTKGVNIRFADAFLQQLEGLGLIVER